MALTKITNSAIADDIGLGGNPTTSTQTAGNSTTRIATTAFVSTAVANLVDSAPDTLNTLAELATSIGNSATLSSTLTTSIATKLPLAGGTLTGALLLGDSVRLNIGTDSDLAIFHTGGNGVIHNTTGALRIRANTLNIQDYANEDAMITAASNGAVTLYHNNTARLSTTSGGILVTGTVQATALSAASTYSSIIYGGSSALQLKSNTGEMFAQFTNNGSAALYHDTILKLATTTTGIDVTGNIGVTGTVDGIDIAARDAVLTSTTTTAGAALPKAGGTMTGDLLFGAGGEIQFGGSNQMGLFTSSGTSHIRINSGIFKLRADDMRFTAQNGTTEYMRIDSNGNVGIGTAAPADRLHVALDSSTTNAEVEVMRVEATSSGTPAVGFGPFIDFRGDRINGGPDSYGRLGFEADAMPSTTVDGAFVVQTAEDGTYSERLRITSDGKVGIGIDTPAYPLEVAGTTSTSIAYQRTGVSAKKWGFHTDNDNTYWQNITDNVLALTIKNNGNVGIGTTSPTTAKLTLADHTTAAGGIKFRTASSSVSLWSSGSGNLNTDKSFNVGSRLRLPGGNSASDPDIGFNGASSGTGFSRAGNDITFITAATERMRISGAEVYVGHTGNTAPWAMTGSAFGISLMGSGGFIGASRSGAEPLLLNRTSSSGPILNLRKDGTTIGAIGVVGGDEMYIASAGTTSGSGLRFQNEGHLIYPTDGLGDVSNGDLDLGNTSYRFKDIYLYREAHVGSIAGSGQVSIYTNDISNGENNGLKLVNTNASTGTTWHITPGLVGQNNHTLTIRNGVTNVNALEIQTNGVATFAGDVTVNGDVQMANGRGISFTASGNASGMTSELLDDYEEGTWTPAFSAYSGTQPTLSQTGSGTYTKIGRQVTVHGTIAVNSISGVVSGLLKIQNLPFGVVTTNTSSGSFASNGLNFARTGHQGLTCIQNTSIGFLTQNMASSWGWEALSILSAGDEIRITFVYETA